MAHPPPHAAQHEGNARSNNSNSSSTVDARGGRVSYGDEPLAVRKPFAPRVHSVRSEYPLNVAVDFTKLRANALRRYMAYHHIQEVPGSSREQLAVAVARHFNEECQRADESASISSFVSYVRRMYWVTLLLTAGFISDSFYVSVCALVKVTSSKIDQDADDHFSHEVAGDDSDKENNYGRNQLPVSIETDADSDFDIDDSARDSAYDYYPNQREEEEGHDDEDDDEDDNRLEDDEYDEPAYAPRKRKPSSSEGSSDAKSSSRGGKSSNGKSSSSSGNNNNGNGSNSKKKKRKARVYCVCKGSSHGNMIACDNKKCLDRSNWYHMGCIGLDDAEDPPETWYCPMCQDQDPSEVPENQYRKPVASVTYGDMISHALAVLPQGKGTFKEICDFVEKQYESQLNWKLESDQRKSPVWKSSVRKILFSNMRFRKHPDDKGLFCLAPSA